MSQCKGQRLARSHGGRMQLTREQQCVVACAAAAGSKPRTTIVMCAAGTGKTTTMVAVARQLAVLGHKHVRYAVFDTGAQESAMRRMGQGVVVKTVHAHALELVGAGCEVAGGSHRSAFW